MVTKEQITEARAIISAVEAKPNLEKILEALGKIGRLGLYMASGAKSRHVRKLGVPLIRPLAGSGPFHFQPALRTTDGGTLLAVRGTQNAGDAVFGTLGDFNRLEERRQLGPSYLLTPSGFGYPQGTHHFHYPPGSDEPVRSVHRDLRQGVLALNPNRTIGNVDVMDGDNFHYPVPNEPGHAMSLEAQTAIATLAISAGAVGELITQSRVVILERPPIPLPRLAAPS